jgi:hypothetical protein
MRGDNEAGRAPNARPIFSEANTVTRWACRLQGRTVICKANEAAALLIEGVLLALNNPNNPTTPPRLSP